MSRSNGDADVIREGGTGRGSGQSSSSSASNMHCVPVTELCCTIGNRLVGVRSTFRGFALSLWHHCANRNRRYQGPADLAGELRSVNLATTA